MESLGLDKCEDSFGERSQEISFNVVSLGFTGEVMVEQSVEEVTSI